MGWPIETYLQQDHPLQVEVNRRVAELIGLPAEELVAERDDCGAPTLVLTPGWERHSLSLIHI